MAVSYTAEMECWRVDSLPADPAAAGLLGDLMAGRLPDAVAEGVVTVDVVVVTVVTATVDELWDRDFVAAAVVTVTDAAVDTTDTAAGTGVSAITLASWLVRLGLAEVVVVEVVTGG